MVRSIIRLVLIACMLTGCIEPYTFVIENNYPTLVVEGFISDVSYNETVGYPSDGRYFTVILRYTSDVSATIDKLAENASVTLISDSGERWIYSQSPRKPGHYFLDNKDFKARAGTEYKLQISLADGKSYESGWEKLPENATDAIGAIDFEETSKQVYEVQAGEEVVTTRKGINLRIDLPRREPGNTVYYRWKFEPTWIYVAPLARSSQPDFRCWATSGNFLSGYALQADHTGGYKKDLFFMEVDGNERIFERLSVLVNQYAMTEDHYYFWKEMQDQAEGGFIQDKPPYNLQTNIKAVDSDERVSGYFGVVNEEAKRWYFSTKDLSYYVYDYLKEECLKPYGPPVRGEPNPCLSCLAYPHGSATNIKPSWWEGQ
ncbi:hypothetical protein D770_20960 [Flammeovirgaceae bacterium 311]|nr:hypothetical protein D770_20960 [Flammeovirgaceae bacterium 311]